MKKSFWHDYSLSIVLAVLFITSFALQIVAQIALGEGFWEVVKSTMENWQSEALQLVTFVVLSALFIHRGSPQSKDGDDWRDDVLSKINAKLTDVVAQVCGVSRELYRARYKVEGVKPGDDGVEQFAEVTLVRVAGGNRRAPRTLVLRTSDFARAYEIGRDAPTIEVVVTQSVVVSQFRDITFTTVEAETR